MIFDVNCPFKRRKGNKYEMRIGKKAVIHQKSDAHCNVINLELNT